MSRMRFIADLNGKEHVIDVDNHGHDDGYYSMTLDGEHTYEVDAQLMQSRIVSALIDQHSYDVDLEHAGDESDTLDGRLAVRVRGRVMKFHMLDERRHKMKQAAHAHLSGGGAGQIDSPMPGKVLKLLCAEGDTVAEGDGVVVVEAMKMENELRAPIGGVVTKVMASEGQTVDAGTPLVLIEADDE